MMEEERDAKLVQAEFFISFVLRYGVLLCASVIAAGIFLSFIRPHSDPGKSTQIETLVRGQVLDAFQPISSPVALFKGLLKGDPEIFITAGLLLLIGLPIARVALTVLVFLFERDWAFVLITTVVFSVLMSGIIMGRAL